jgi:head-tail adaptor
MRPRHRIQIFKRLETRNSVGETLYSFEPLCTTWAEFSREDNPGIITIRYQRDLLPGYRVAVSESEHYEIVSVVDQYREGRIKFVELGLKPVQAGLEMQPAPARWTASRGFLARETNTDKENSSC